MYETNNYNTNHSLLFEIIYCHCFIRKINCSYKGMGVSVCVCVKFVIIHTGNVML